MTAIRRLLAGSPLVERLRDQYLLASSYWSDWTRFRRGSGMGPGRGLHARIVMDAHRVEKGLTLAEPRAWFGREVVERLLGNLERLAVAESTPTTTYLRDAAVGALAEYFAAQDATSMPDWAAAARSRAQRIAERIPAGRPDSVGGTEPIGPTALEASAVTADTFERFVRSRHSVRHYRDAEADRGVIDAAVAVAATSPSVCNRQGSRVRVLPRGHRAEAVLALQNGNGGFGSAASHILVITQDLESFVTPGERNQAFVDGGLFAMTLMYALHASGLGTCALNWSRTAADDRRLRRVLALPDSEVVVMLLAVGLPAQRAVVTRSPLRPGIVI